ncbi:MAG: DUF1573 domain-containing protein [Candidatus Komeilibacteria bacterium]|nr:DUF1573 domain-containing protein [Candidatus Komeilibacteria bacterium]
MKKKTKKQAWIISGLAVVLVLVVVYALSSKTAEPVVDAQLRVAETNWNWGDIAMRDGIASKEVEMTNDSSTPITITRMETSCMCTTVQIMHVDGSKSALRGMVGHGSNATLSETIAAGETVKLKINFDPNAHGPNATGRMSRSIILQTNSQAQPEIRLTFVGNVIK